MTSMPFIDLASQRARIGPAVERAMARVLAHGQFVLGPEVLELEDRLAVRSSVRRVVTVGSGTDALLLTLRAWGIGPGDAVIIPAFTFVATAEAVALLGATPVFCDVGEDDFHLDPTQVPRAVAVARDLGLRTRAVIVVGLYGQPADEAALARVAEDEGLMVLGDAAQSYGAQFGGRDTARFGHATATSFFPSKPLGCYGDGGAVFTDDVDLADRLVSLRMHGYSEDRYQHVRVGTTSRLDTLQAAVLLEKLGVFDDEVRARQAVADRYAALLDGLVRLPIVRPGRTSVWAQYTVRVPDRLRVVAELQAAGVPTAVHYPMPLHRQPAYQRHPRVAPSLSVAEQLATEVLSLPMHPYLAPDVQDRICSALRGAVERSS